MHSQIINFSFFGKGLCFFGCPWKKSIGLDDHWLDN